MRRRVPVAFALFVVVLAGCASRGQVRALEGRIAALEQAQRERAIGETTSWVELNGRVAALRLEVERLTAAGDRAAALEDRMAQLERARPPAPPPRPIRPQPDPTAVYAVPVDGAPSLGRDDALVTIVRAGEYACPYCEKVRATLDELRAIYGDRLRIVSRNYVVHLQLATLPARAACAAHKQGRFWQLDRLLWDKAFVPRQFDQAHLEVLAVEAGLDLDTFRADAGGPCVAEVQAEMTMLERFGVRATPAFFINGRYLAGAQPTAAFRAIIDEELARAQDREKGRRKGKGTYYQRWVLATGLPGLATTTPAPIAAPAGATP